MDKDLTVYLYGYKTDLDRLFPTNKVTIRSPPRAQTRSSGNPPPMCPSYVAITRHQDHSLIQRLKAVAINQNITWQSRNFISFPVFILTLKVFNPQSQKHKLTIKETQGDGSGHNRRNHREGLREQRCSLQEERGGAIRRPRPQ